MRKISLVLHNIRSTYNVGAITRTAECLGVEHIYATGYTPYTSSKESIAPPHVTKKMLADIHKTALGAEETLPVNHQKDIKQLIAEHRNNGYKIVALEQNESAQMIYSYADDAPLLLILGEEVNGVTEEILNEVDSTLEIPMLGKKESFNVSVATGIALYELRRYVFTEQSR